MTTSPTTMGAGSEAWRREIRAMATLAWPIVLTNLAQNAMQTTDVVMMGWLGPDALAAGTLGFNIYFTPMIFGMGLLLAVSPMVAFELGRRAHSVRDVRRTVRQGLWIAFMLAIPLWALMWQGEAILVAMGQDPALAADAGSYLRAMQWALLPFYFYIVLRSFVSALERPGWALAIMAVAVLFNVFANWVLMFGNLGFPAYGIVGTGIATTLSATLMCAGLALVVLWHRKFRRYHVFGRFWRPDWPRFREMVRIGLPISGILTFEVGLFGASALLMGLIGAASLAAHAIAIQLASIAFMVPMGIAQAATVRVGRACGAGSEQGIMVSGWVAFALGVAFMTMTATLMVTMPHLLISAFLDLDDPVNAEVVGLAVLFLAVAALFQIVDGAQAVAGGMLRGLQDTKVPMFYAAIGYWGIGMPSGILLAFWFGMGGAGIWLGLCIGLAVVAFMLVVRWLRRDRLMQGRMPLNPSR
ncbi:MAG: MATE family efflux transporter [Mesorhizobium sp.]|nr:MATE family efflux transporter [Mesorhizobium sp.]